MKISSDDSKCGLDAVILQQHDGEWQPVAYASSAMTSAETRYAQIEKELFSVMFACERFHQFICGQTMIAETDHKPLVNLFHKSLNDCPLRIQRLMIRLQKYSRKVSYTPGKCMHTADALSGATDPNEAQSSTEEYVKVYVNMVTSIMPVSSDRMDKIRCEAENSMKPLIESIQKGWPPTMDACDGKIREFWNCREAVSVIDGVIFKGSNIVIPTSTRKLTLKILKKIHQGHLGM